MDETTIPRADRKPDGAMMPVGTFKGKIPLGQRLRALNLMFGPVFGVKGVEARKTQARRCTFVTPKDAKVRTVLFPTGHPLAKQERFDWYVAEFDRKERQFRLTGEQVASYQDHGGRILLGWTKDDPHADDPLVLSEIKSDLDRRMLDAASRQSQLTGTGTRDDDTDTDTDTDTDPIEI